MLMLGFVNRMICSKCLKMGSTLALSLTCNHGACPGPSHWISIVAKQCTIHYTLEQIYSLSNYRCKEYLGIQLLFHARCTYQWHRNTCIANAKAQFTAAISASHASTNTASGFHSGIFFWTCKVHEISENGYKVFLLHLVKITGSHLISRFYNNGLIEPTIRHWAPQRITRHTTVSSAL